jgi:protein PhnA
MGGRMSVENILNDRSRGKCELCSSSDDLNVFAILPARGAGADSAVNLCQVCRGAIGAPDSSDPNHWRCLSESMWSEHPPVQILAHRILTHLAKSGQAWADDLLGQIYLDDELLAWAAEAPLHAGDSDDDQAPTVDSNGTRLSAGDTVTLIKDLEVKGANFTAKRGTTVKNIP